MKTENNFNIPSDILDKARNVSLWFKKQSIEYWQLEDVCSRKAFIATKEHLENCLSLLEKTSKILGKRSGESIDQAAERAVVRSAFLVIGKRQVFHNAEYYTTNFSIEKDTLGVFKDRNSANNFIASIIVSKVYKPAKHIFAYDICYRIKNTTYFDMSIEEWEID